MTATPALIQGTLHAPGWCCRCPNRLSVANTDGICDECQSHPLDPVVNPCARCGVNERKTGDAYCPPCRIVLRRQSEEKRKQRLRRPPLNIPCACCGKAPRKPGYSYCVTCSGEYQAARQKRRAHDTGRGG